MVHNKVITDTKHFKLLRAIHAAGGVPCEPYPELFFPEDLTDPELRSAYTKVAKALCQTCPIIEQCFTYALTTNQRHGIWGGTTPGDRI
jgi:WhiB family redox-sensing transcriptional regulator